METTQDVARSQPRYSEEFNAEDAEVTYESCDGVRFRIHAVYLRAHTEGLAPIPGSTFEEVVPLAESASVLEMLFRFIYPRRQLDLETSLEFEVLKELAEVAEKYQVYPAMYASYLQMRATLPKHALDILAYALKHDYSDIVNEAGPLVLDEPAWDILNTIPTEYHEAWMKYHHRWQEAQKRAFTTHFISMMDQNPGIVSRVASGLLAMYQLDKTFGSATSNWRSLIEADIREITPLAQSIGSLANDAPPVLVPNSQDQDHDMIECGDNIQLQADSETLRACGPGFIALVSEDSKIHVTENSSTILLLLHFIRPVRLPDLSALPFDELSGLAYAAEKYSLFQAMQICKVFVKRRLPSNPAEIFSYGARHGYIDILDACAPLMLHMPIDDMASHLSPTLLLAWTRYYQKWQDICREIILKLTTRGSGIKSRICQSYNCPPSAIRGVCSCRTVFSEHARPVIEKLLDGPQCLSDVGSLFKAPCRSSESGQIFKECQLAVEDGSRTILPLSTFVI